MRECNNVYRFDLINAEDADLCCIDKTIFVLASSEEEAKSHVQLVDNYEVRLIELHGVFHSIE